MNEKIIWDYMKKVGLTDAGAAGLMGNLYAESGLDPGKCEKLCLNRLREYGLGDYTSESYTAAVNSRQITRERFLQPVPGKHYGYGLCQWTTESRKGALYDHMMTRGKGIEDLEGQMIFLVKELQTSYGGVWKVITTSESPAACSDIILMRFETPAQWSQYVDIRRSYAEKYYEKYKEKEEPTMSEPGFDRQKVIALARAEEGYLEKSAAWWRKHGAAGLYEKTAGAGSDNYTKYGYEMHKLYPQVMDFPAAWCDAGVDWLFMTAYGVSNAKKLLGGNFDDYTVASAQLYKDKGAWRNGGIVPEPGWQIFFKNSTRIYHTGLVLEVVESGGKKYVVTWEGNTSSAAGVVANGGCTRIKTYQVDYDRIAGYGVPPYGDAAVKAKIEFTPHWIHTEDGSWYYRVAEGQNAHGWHLINGHWYYFDEKGKMLTGLQYIDGFDGPAWYALATREVSEDFEGACMMSDEAGRLEVWDVI